MLVAGDRYAERVTEAVDDAGLEEKRLDVLRQALEHIVAQVVDDVAVPANDLG